MSGIIKELPIISGPSGTNTGEIFSSTVFGYMGFILSGNFNGGSVRIEVSPLLDEEIWAEVESLRFTGPGYKTGLVFGRRIRVSVFGNAANATLRVFMMNNLYSAVLRSDN